ncbi:hypothetical protein GCK32_020593 [Trichostrongylus colubriformis]|uniref:Uncharacterized protein n=1 Tax=Trichostrongylus colubriformis TaxID=6319 RepID=A0AAN8FN52_TRICO
MQEEPTNVTSWRMGAASAVDERRFLGNFASIRSSFSVW